MSMTVFKTPKELAEVTLGERPGPHLEAAGRNQVGATFVEDGRELRVAVTVASGRARSVSVTYQPPFDVERGSETDAADCERLFADWSARLEAHFGAKVTKKTKRSVELKLRKPHAAHVFLSFQAMRGPDGDDSYAVSLSKTLDTSVVLPVDASALWFDVAKVAPLLASKKFDVEQVTALALAHFTGTPHSLSDKWLRVVFEARAAAKKRAPEIVEQLLLVMPFTDLELTGWFFSYLCQAHRRDSYAAKRLVRTPFQLLRNLLERVAPPVSERGQVALTILRALEHGDPEATHALLQRLGPGEVPTFNADDELQDRLFALLTTNDDELGKLRLPLQARSGNAEYVLDACVRALGPASTPLPQLPTVEDASARASAEAWARYFHLVRDRFPTHLDALAEAFARARLFGAHTIPSVAAVAGRQVSKTVFEVGHSRFTVRGNQASAD